MKSIKNNLYMIRLMWKACPLRVILNIVKWIWWRVGEMFYSIFLLRFIVKAIETGRDFSSILILLVIMLVYALVTNSVMAWYRQWYIPIGDTKVHEYLLKKMYEKAMDCDLSCYQNH